jgi:lysyl endopeptidase
MKKVIRQTLKLFLINRLIILVYFAFLFSVLFLEGLSAQQSVSGIPFSIAFKVGRIAEYEVMPEYVQSQSQRQQSSRLKSLEFAHVFEVSFSPETSGEWLKAENGNKIWRIGLVSKGAYSLNLTFDHFKLADKVKLYVYSPDYHKILGAYSSVNNNSAEKLAVEPIQGDSLIVELNIPEDVDHYGKLDIKRLGHDFVNIFGSLKSAGSELVSSGSCNVDINCEQGLDWQREKYAVCKLIVNNQDLCTGTLINNTALDNTPYVITANHCIDTTIKAEATVFIFNYEKWKCGGEDGPTPLTLSGSQLMATTPLLDFALVKMYTLPFFSSKPYLAGWNSSTTPSTSSVTIHHPGGDFKKISIDQNAAISSTYPDDYLNNTHWKISRWETGTTERGSSGCPLFNQNHEFIGDLTGGDATCTNPVNDYFAKFSSSWAYFTASDRQLKNWLDPLNSSEVSLAGHDPYEAIKSSCDTLGNVGKTESKVLYKDNLTWGTYSGQNSLLFTQFAEKIETTEDLKIAGFYLDVAKAYYASALSYVTFRIWKGGDLPGDMITERAVFLKDITAGARNYFDFDSTIQVAGPLYLGYAVNYSAKPDTFSVFQAGNRGETGFSGMYVFKDETWQNFKDVTNPSVYSSLAVGLVSCSLLTKTPSTIVETKRLKVYPNPTSSGNITVELPDTSEAIVSVYDLTGRKSRVEYFYENEHIQLNTSNLVSGIYIINVVVPGRGTYRAKFSVIK